MNLYTSTITTIFFMSIISGILGPFMLWKRLSYFSDTIAHSSLLAITLNSLVPYIPNIIMVFFASILFAGILIKVSYIYSHDTILNIINSSSVAVAVLLLSTFPEVFQLNINHVLFGDILITNNLNMIILAFATVVIVGLTIFRWRSWLLVTINEDIARISGLNINLTKAEFIIILSFFISLAINMVGSLLITALLVIPAATARVFSDSPLKMIILATLICFLGNIGGLLTSIKINSPTGLTMIAFSFLILLISYILHETVYKRQ